MRFILPLAIFIVASANAQTDDLVSRMQALRRGKMEFFNVDGVEISYLPMAGEFTPKDIAKKYGAILKNYKEVKVKTSDFTVSDTLLGLRNYYVRKTIDREGLPGYQDEYFIESKSGTIAVAFQSTHELTQDFERQVAMLFIRKEIPANVFQPSRMDSINFAGRYIYLGGPCHWMSVNNLQCPTNGQMSWSSFPTLGQAQKDIDDHFEFLKRSNKGQIISDEQVDVLFEGQETKARKIVFDFKGVTSVLVGMSGGKVLTIFMAAAPIRGRFVSAVMSHWNNDYVGEEGLPALTSDVLRIKK